LAIGGSERIVGWIAFRHEWRLHLGFIARPERDFKRLTECPWNPLELIGRG